MCKQTLDEKFHQYIDEMEQKRIEFANTVICDSCNNDNIDIFFYGNKLYEVSCRDCGKILFTQN